MQQGSEKPPCSKVVFIGAGPGHPDLMTVRARQWLARANVVVHDVLVPQELLATVNPTADRVPVPRGAATSTDPGTEIGAMLVRLATEHRTVIRLKGGDPSVFARLAEELKPLHQAGVAIEIVPGVTAAFAAAAAAGIPITSRMAASSVTLITGHEADKEQSGVDFQLLSKLSGTIAIYMGVDQAATWSQSLLNAGKPAETPVTIVSRCSWPDQRIAVSSLGRCGADFAAHAWLAPAVAIVGEVAQLPPAMSASLQPLAGRRVLVTRPTGQGETIVDLIAGQGGMGIHVPVMRIESPSSWQNLDAAIRAVDTFDWIIFSSVNGVQSFLRRLGTLGLDGRWLGTARLAAVGPATAAALSAGGYVCDLVADSFRAEGILEKMISLPSSRFLLIRAERGRDVLFRGLTAAGHSVEEAVAYRSVPITILEPATQALLSQCPIDWVVVTSPAIAHAAVDLFGSAMESWRIASISPLTSEALATRGAKPTAEAKEASATGLVNAMVAWELTHSEQSPHSEWSSPTARP